MDAERIHLEFRMADVIHVTLSDDEFRRLRFAASIACASGLSMDALEEFLAATDDV